MTENAKTLLNREGLLGIEFGSTRIKAVLIDENNKPIAQGSHEWENQLVNGLRDLQPGGNAVWSSGLLPRPPRQCQRALRLRNQAACRHRRERDDARLHALRRQREMLASFRTWRNTNTGEAAEILSKLFNFNMPLRWSLSHLYQAILDEEPHVKDVAFLTTLAGYIHWQLTGEKVIGIGDASGIMPICSESKTYAAEMVAKFDNLVADKGFGWKLEEILPKVLLAGENAGRLTEEAKRIDISGNLQAGAPLCPPEGDAGTGMVATNAVKIRTGNVSAKHVIILNDRS